MKNLERFTWVVSTHFVGTRLQAFLKQRLPVDFSGKLIKEMIDHYGCRVNGKVEVFSSYKVKNGDRIQIDPEKLKKRIEPKGIKILYEDEDLWVVDKPQGVSSDPLEIKKLFKQEVLYLVHRLDKETTGVLLIAKNPSMQKSLETLFKQREVEKLYHALVEGKVKEETFAVDNILGKVASYQGQSLWGAVSPSQGKQALTHFKVLKAKGPYHLLECKPITGRTHQIRVHLHGMGCPILGDYHYVRNKPFSYKACRVLLHAKSLQFVHPKSKKKLKVESSYPQDFNQALFDLFA